MSRPHPPRVARPFISRNQQSLSSRLDPDLVQTLSQSRESLELVSSAIEAAYDRLLALTTRLNLTLQTMPNERRDGNNSTDMGPEHSAILLSTPSPPSTVSHADAPVVMTGAAPQQSAAERSSTPRPTTALTADTIRQRFAELTRDVEDHANPALSDGEGASSTSTLLFGPRSQDAVQARRSFVMSYLMQRRGENNSSDPSTSLGRRVERRAAAASNSTDRIADDYIHDAMDESSFTVTVLNRQREQLVESSRNFRAALSSTPTPTGDFGMRVRVGTSQNPSPAPPPADSSSGSAAGLPWVSRDRTALWRENLREHRPTSSSAVESAMAVDRSRSRSILSLPPLSLPSRERDGERPPFSDDAFELPALDTEPEDAPFSFARRSRITPQTAIFGSDSEDDDDPYSWMMTGDSRRPQPPLVGLDTARQRSDMLGRMRADHSEGLSGLSGSSNGLSMLTWHNNFGERGNLERAMNPDESQLANDSAVRRRRRRGWGKPLPFIILND